MQTSNLSFYSLVVMCKVYTWFFAIYLLVSICITLVFNTFHYLHRLKWLVSSESRTTLWLVSLLLMLSALTISRSFITAGIATANIVCINKVDTCIIFITKVNKTVKSLHFLFFHIYMNIWVKLTTWRSVKFSNFGHLMAFGQWLLCNF